MTGAEESTGREWQGLRGKQVHEEEERVNKNGRCSEERKGRGKREAMPG